MDRNAIWKAALILVGVVLLGFAAVWLGGVFKLKDDWQSDIFVSLQYMAVFALLIERSVEVYLGAAGMNGDDRFDVATSERLQNAVRPASIAAIVLGLLVALSGIRLMQAIGSLEGGNALANAIWAGVDIVVSGGLMAGGSALIHEVAELIRGTLKRVSGNLATGAGTRGTEGTSGTQDGVTVATSYVISVTRSGSDSGRLTFSDGDVKIDTTCWWDPGNVIAAGTYGGCSKTRMATKKDSVTGLRRPGIFLSTAVSPKTGEQTIFIHEGTGPNWSDGCIVLTRDEMMSMWNRINPMDGKNVTVVVTDAA